MNKQKNRHMIWSNLNIDVEEWKDGYKEYLEINGLPVDDDDITDEKILDYAIETNNEYLDFERLNIGMDLPADIIAIADIGTWQGRVMGYKKIGYNIKNCLSTDCDYAEWYVDRYGNLRFTGHHHDGTNYILYRMFRPELTEEQRENFANKVYYGKVTNTDIARYTVRIGDYVGKVHGWKFSGRRPNIAKTRNKRG
jgi:hypothetical protein